MKKFFLLLIVLHFALISIVSAETVSDSFVKINVKDTLRIRVHNNEELNTSVRVTEDGYINFPFVGSVYVKGKTIKEIEDIIEKKLADYINFPIVSIILTRGFETQKVFLYGELGMHGEILFEKGLTLLKVLSLTGGITEGGLHGRLLVRRKTNEGYKDIELDIENILNLNSQTGDMLLQPDDFVIVEPNKEFLIDGAVKDPKRYTLEKGMTVRRALSLAGGITEDGLYGRLLVRRRTNEGYKDIELDIENILNLNSQTGDMLLQPDDIVIVEPNRTFIIEGNVNSPGSYALKKGMTAKMALLEAGVIDLYGQVIVRREKEGTPGHQEIELFFKGDVRGSSSGDMLLQPSDMIIVGHNETYFVYGEINSPGKYKLEKDSTVFTAMLIAGGITKWGSEDRIKILRRAEKGKGDFTAIKVKIGDFIQGDASADVALEPGDIIIFTTGIL